MFILIIPFQRLTEYKLKETPESFHPKPHLRDKETESHHCTESLYSPNACHVKGTRKALGLSDHVIYELKSLNCNFLEHYSNRFERIENLTIMNR